MQIEIIPKQDATESQLRRIESRLTAPEHKNDTGPPTIWDTLGYQPNLFIAVDASTGDPVGVLHRSGPLALMDASWWLDSKHRGRRIGSKMIDAFATILVSEGVTNLAPITIQTRQGEYDTASRRLVGRLRASI